ncbi:hypothetical protein SEA_PIPER2020_69 [Mycobacterium phage Piper2020]|uniref:DUF7448 domain-containing protein n=1 Tax=Mycobacterium phage LilSpotty TaxID=2588512 RepID=A0A4Y6EP07_9CAUD|nr:hypothetical protein QEH38_gp65 [Mycobacterium phage LilSpotty]AVP42365.1 hypothetical protein SEA_MISHA28_66 [Mycobacterium phage Misha28]AVP42455.1 hypothetical protein SEA_TOOTSIEPOP_66 [Mycobacterium phage TootsiePop]QBP31748.1 hypothetical protein SEA_PIPER2020_69 [Mycobacterium phage Piper2020]QKO03251.1 hypothetical protein SEA_AWESOMESAUCE_68 [Mycobacterium phage Awesomesauce]QDF19797.1 hypothetical protein SEA_LILSPOTTY_65 [Mycobacterium phage LilSpotty]
MSADRYPAELLGDDDDDGTMPDNVDALRQAVVGRRIVSATKGQAKVVVNRWGGERLEDVTGLIIELDDGTKVILQDTSDCCAYTELESFFLAPNSVDHIITGVGTTDGYETWHIYADMGDILKLKVGWSPGNPFYYGYGFDIHVSRIIDGEVVPDVKAIEP